MPIPNDLETMAAAGKCVPLEVVSVAGTTWALNHPALLRDLARGGGVLRKVEKEEDVLLLFRHRDFLPWGFAATLIVECSPGLQVKKAWGRGVRKQQEDGSVQIEIGCLEGTPLVGLQLAPTKKKSKQGVQDSAPSLTLHLCYTNKHG
ncbi:hypothetical protein Pmani_037833 [Petrolisthes manimaculis]|uniref:Uncharacterized protein n=1 Tax=Petrolisthes manimaculis TaxID=1843537 RepID=A0AAE1NI84_9EUCA|nr:hypothetical protein Pmani_037833 [Petrolisthes manimaculis]